MASLEHLVPGSTAVLLTVAGIVLYQLGKVLYRLFYHPLKDFPGPRLAAATFWYEIYFDVFKAPGGQFIYELDRLHDIYGPVVRCNPEEIHVRDSSWYDTLYSGPGHVRDKWERSNRANGAPGSVASTVNHDLHRARKAAVFPLFSKRTINELEDSIRKIPMSRQLEEIPLMKAVVQEGLRIAAPVTSRPMLIAPNEDLRCGEWIIPRGTPCSLSHRNVLYDPKIFPEPHTFNPDRWILAAQKGERLDRFLVTFGKGTRSCLGTNLAYAELIIAVATMVSRFDMELVDFDQQRDIEIVRDRFVGMPSKESRGVRVKLEIRR